MRITVQINVTESEPAEGPLTCSFASIVGSLFSSPNE